MIQKVEILKILPILIMTSAMLIVAFLPIKKNKKTIIVITAFVLWLSTFAITWFSLLK